MKQFETSMLLVKPDGVEKGHVDAIRTIITANGLVIKKEEQKLLKPVTVEMLYWSISDVRHRDYFPELVQFMSSAPVHIFIVEGYDAVSKVRDIIGKRTPSSGIRAQWAESIIKNVAHGPHSAARANREIELVLSDKTAKKVFLIGGMSESGKSTFGKHLDSLGIKRLKIVFFLKRVMEREGITGDFSAWNTKNVKERPEWVYKVFADEFIAWAEEQGIENCCLESLYGPDLGVYMRNRLGDNRGVVVYVNMEEEIRLQRQMIRENLSTLEEAKKIMLPRDQIKKEWRMPEIANVADVIVDNSGTMDTLLETADAMVRKYCPELFIN